MNFVQQLEESLRDLASEARKRHPGVKEASERATLTLRQYKNAYASAVRQANASSAAAPTTKVFQSSELLHPFLLAANYPNASPKLLEITFKAMRLLLEADAVVPNDCIHLVRVWMIQAQVVATYFQKHNKSNHVQKESMPSLMEETEGERGDQKSYSTDETTKGNDATTTSSSSWFFWSSSSSTTAPGNSVASESSTATSLTSSASMADQPPPSNVVSSSTGQSGHSGSNASSKEMEKLALDILSSLSLLMQMMHRNYPEQLVNDAVLWKHNFSVLCLCLSPFMNNTRGVSSGGGNSHSTSGKKKGSSKKASSSVIQQAAHSTLSQILTLLYEPIPDRLDEQGQPLESNPTFVQFREATWQDLLRLCQASSTKSVASLQGAFALCKTTAAAGSASFSKKGTPPPVPVPPSPSLALQVLTKMWRNSQYKITSDVVATDTLHMTLTLVTSIQSNNMTSVEAPYAIFQWSQLVVSKLGEDYSADSYKVVHALLKLVAVASESCRRHPDFEDGFVYSHEYASSVGKGDSAMATSRSSMTQAQQPQQPQDSSKSGQSNTLPLIPAKTLGKASLALDALSHILADDHVASMIIKDPATVGLATETMSDFATLAASSGPHMIQLVDYIASRAGAEGQYQQQTQGQSEPFVRKLEHDLDSDWENLIDHSTLGEAVWLSLSSVLRILECVFHLKIGGKVQVAELFAPSLAVLQHYLKRFCGSAALVRMSLDGYESLSKLCFPSVDMQKALLTSLCKLSLPSWGKRDHSSLLEDQHVEALLSVIRIMHMYHEDIDTDWEIILMTLEDLSALSVASKNLTDGAYHSALAISSIYGRIAAFSTCFSNSSLIKMMDALCQVVEESVQEKSFLAETGKSTPALQKETTSERHGSIGERLMKAGVSAIYGSQQTENIAKDEPVVSTRTKTRFYEEYRRDFVRRTSKVIRTDSIGRVPFSLAIIADVSMANSFRYNDCGEKLSSLLSKLAVAAPLVRPFLMDTIAIMTKFQMSETNVSSPAPFIGPGRIVFENPMQSQLLAVEKIQLAPHSSLETKDAAADSKSRPVGKIDETPQSALLVPLCDSLRTAKKPEVAESSLETLHSVVETTGHNFSETSWDLVISALSTLSGDASVNDMRSTTEWSKCSLDAFGCLKFIVNDFIDELPAASNARKSLLDCCFYFGNSRHDVNTSLTAIGLLWRIADQDSSPDAIDRALSKLVLLTNDSRPEVRNASVNTLFSCIVGRGSSFSPAFWETCMQGIIFKVYDKVSARARGEEVPPSPNVPTESKKSRYQVPVHHSRDSETKQWVATQIVVLRGLVRVLRSFFSKLLETIGSIQIKDQTQALEEEDNVPWFQDAWVQILDYAYEAAAQGGDRETLDIRNVGVELLVLCCQLSSKGGLKALSPARVGTNMEVIDGALRTVRDAKSQGEKDQGSFRSNLINESSRENLFLEAFESLESYVEFLGNLEVHGLEMDDTQLQVIQSFSYNLKSLYDGGKDVDLKKDNKARCLECFESGSSRIEGQQIVPEEDLEGRLVKLVATVLELCTIDLTARFLNQAQRSCLTLLKAMACDGSCDALRLLVDLGNIFFFIRKDGDDLKIQKSECVGLEAIASLTEAMGAPDPAEECKCLILNEVLSSFVRKGKEGFLAERQNRQFKTDYKRLVPIISHGLDSCEALRIARKDSQDSPNYRVTSRSWLQLKDAIDIMVTPLPMGNGMSKMSRVVEVKDIIHVAVSKVPSEFATPLCEVLIQSATSCLEVAELHESCSIKHDDKSVASKSKQHRDELLLLFSECVFGSCVLDPKHAQLKASIASWLHHAVTAMTSSPSDGETYIVDAATYICQSVRKVDGAEVLLPGMFPHLCQLTGTKDVSLRNEVIQTLSSEKAQSVLEASDRRVSEAEDRAARLVQEKTELQQENDRLRQTIAVLEAGPGI